MEYNDNFVIPPEEMLDKMQKAYTKSLSSASILSEKVSLNKTKILKHSERALKALMKSYIHIKTLHKTSTSGIARVKIKQLMDKTKSNVEELKILYEELDIDCFNKKIIASRSYCNALKQSINIEVDAVRELFDLRKLENDENTKKLVDRVTDNRLDILKELNGLFGTCSYRNYK